ncbi:MAG: hypothetical protein AABX88_02685 [Nanoarchaeota archaeon]
MQELLNELNKLNLPKDEFAIFGSAVMAIKGIREAKDIDLIVTNELYKKLIKKYKEIKPGIIQVGNIEIIASWNSLIKNPEEVIKNSERIGDYNYIRLKDLIAWKKKMGREKDKNDIKLIKEYKNAGIN